VWARVQALIALNEAHLLAQGHLADQLHRAREVGVVPGVR
jgi:hypothetical protein